MKSLLSSQTATLVALVVASLLCGCMVAATPVEVATASVPVPSKHIIFISIPLPGHVLPLMAQGHELAKRGYRVSIATTSKLGPFITQRLTQPSNTLGGSISYLSAGDCPVQYETKELFLNCSLNPDFNDGSNAVFDWAMRLFPCMYTTLMDSLSKEAKPLLIVGDVVTWVSNDVAYALNAPSAVNNADLLYILSPHVLPPFDSVPGAMSYTTARSMVATDGLLQRVLYPPIRVLIIGLFLANLQQQLQNQRSVAGSKCPDTILNGHQGKLVLIESAFGIEYSRPLPPLIHMVGPMIHDESLSQVDRDWLESDPRPVVFVSFGTLAPLSASQASLLVEGLRSSSYRVIFKIDQSMHDIMPSLLPDNIRLESWVSSQMAHLAHPKVKVFISHCGINSAHESIYYGTALLCIPMFGDQLDMGYRVADAGVGVWLNKLTFTSSQVSQQVDELIADVNGTIALSLKRLSSSLRLAGGVQRAADLLEHVALHGVSHLATADTKYQQMAYYNLDVYVIWSLLIVIPLLLSYTCCRCCQCCCRRCCCRSSRPSHTNGHTNGHTNNGNYTNGNGKKHD